MTESQRIRNSKRASSDNNEFKPTKPSRRNGTSNWQHVRRLPLRFHDNIANHNFNVDLPAFRDAVSRTVSLQVTSKIEFSLGTKDYYTACKRAKLCDDVLMNIFESLLHGKASPSDQQISSYARSIYKFYKDKYVDSTGLPDDTKTIKTLGVLPYAEQMSLMPILKKKPEGLEYWEIWEESWNNGYRPDEDCIDAVETRVGSLVNWWMFLNIDRLKREDRDRLVQATDKYAREIESRNAKILNNRDALTFTGTDSEFDFTGVTFSQILDHWAATQERYPKTFDRRKNALKVFETFVQHNLAHKLTAQDFGNFQIFLRRKNYQPNTINTDYVSGLRALFNHAKTKGLIQFNHASALTKVPNTRRKTRAGYTNDQISALISEAKSHSDRMIGWIVLLTINTGCRVTEITQLGADQIYLYDANTSGQNQRYEVHIRPSSYQGGRLKNFHSERQVPLTSMLFDDEFFEFAKSRNGKPLFYDVKHGRSAKSREYEAVSRRTGRWINSMFSADVRKNQQGIKIDTHNGIRHWLQTRMPQVTQNIDLVEAIIGHERQGVREFYNDYSYDLKLSVIEDALRFNKI